MEEKVWNCVSDYVSVQDAQEYERFLHELHGAHRDGVSWRRKSCRAHRWEPMMTSKQRAYLKSLASNLDPIFQIGKENLTPEVTMAIQEAFNRRELIKIGVLRSCLDDPGEMAAILAERTHSQVVQVIGKKIVLYKENKEHKKIELP